MSSTTTSAGCSRTRDSARRPDLGEVHAEAVQTQAAPQRAPDRGVVVHHEHPSPALCTAVHPSSSAPAGAHLGLFVRAVSRGGRPCATLVWSPVPVVATFAAPRSGAQGAYGIRRPGRCRRRGACGVPRTGCAVPAWCGDGVIDGRAEAPGREHDGAEVSGMAARRTGAGHRAGGRRGKAADAAHRRPGQAGRALRRGLPAGGLRTVEPRQRGDPADLRAHAVQVALAGQARLDDLAADRPAGATTSRPCPRSSASGRAGSWAAPTRSTSRSTSSTTNSPTTSSSSARTTSTAWTRARCSGSTSTGGAGVTVAGIKVPRDQAASFGVISADPGSLRIGEFLEKPVGPAGAARTTRSTSSPPWATTSSPPRCSWTP